MTSSQSIESRISFRVQREFPPLSPRFRTSAPSAPSRGNPFRSKNSTCNLPAPLLIEWGDDRDARNTQSMKSLHVLLGLIALVSSATAAPNTTLYETSFEPPAFTPGIPLRGQDNWEMYHDGEALSVATNNARTGTHCLRFDGALLEQNGPNSATAYCFSRAMEAYSNNPPAIVELTASVRLDGPRTGTNGTPAEDVLSANLMAVVPRSDGQGQSLGGFFVSSAGKIWSYSPTPADAYKYSVPYTFGTYRTLRLRIDFVARTLRYFVDGTYLGLVNFPSSITTDRLYGAYLFLNGALDPIDTPQLTYRMENYTAYFDDYSIVSVPLSPVNAVIEFASTNVLADEFKPTARIHVARRGFTSAAVRVTVSTTNGTAIAGEDYEATSGFVTFAAGETNKVFEVPLKDNFFAEADRSFAVQITDLPPGASSGKPRASVLIRDDERPGSIDYSWVSSYGLPPLGSNQTRWAYPTVFDRVQTQPDGKLIMSIEVDAPDAQGFPQPQYYRLVRLNRDGSPDSSFSIYQSALSIYAYTLPDGKILIAEDAYPRGFRVIRRNIDGTADSSFTTSITNTQVNFKNLPDGKILAYGESISVNAQPPRNVVRLNRDLSLDSTFTVPSNLKVNAAWPLANGQVIIFAYGPPNSFGAIRRLNADGSLDTNFNVGTGLQSTGNYFFWDIRSVIEQEDGKLVLSGYFPTFNGQGHNSVVRLHPSGSIDESFLTGQGFTVRDFTGSRGPSTVKLTALPGGSIAASGEFDQFDGKPVTAPIVLHADGSREASFEGTVPVYDDALLASETYVLGEVDGQLLFVRPEALGRLRMDLPLRIVSHTHDGLGTNRVTANALAGRTYTLQGSDTLNHWDDLVSHPASTNRIEFIDAPTHAPASRFYRVRQE